MPCHIVAIHAKNWTPLGIAMTRLAAEKNDIASGGHPGREHVVDPDAEADEADGDERR